MKSALSLGLALLALGSVARAQVFRPHVVEGGRPVHRVASHGAFGGYVYRAGPIGYAGYSRGYRGGWDAGYYGDYGVVYPSYGYGGYASDGLWLGALAGGIIGNNSGAFHHSAWRGAAWGAGLGWLLGTVAEANRPAVVYAPQTAVTPAPVAASQAASAPQQVTIINNYYGNASPMSGANAMFGR